MDKNQNPDLEQIADMSKCANAIFDKLIEQCGAIEHSRQQFVYYFCEICQDYVHKAYSIHGEFRFGGSLGFGGKIYFNSCQCYVSNYPEDSTSETIEITKKATIEVNQIFQEFLKQGRKNNSEEPK